MILDHSKLIEMSNKSCTMKTIDLEKCIQFEYQYLININVKHGLKNLLELYNILGTNLTPKLFWRAFCSFLKFGQPILVRVCC